MTDLFFMTCYLVIWAFEKSFLNTLNGINLLLLPVSILYVIQNLYLATA